MTTRVFGQRTTTTPNIAVSQHRISYVSYEYGNLRCNAMAICIATVMGVTLVAGRAPDSEYSSEAMIAKLAEGAWRGSESGVPADFECE